MRCCHVASGGGDPDAAACATSANRNQRDERAALAAFGAARADKEFFTEHTEQDPEYQSLLAALWSQSRHLLAELRRQYQVMRDRLSIHHRLVLLDCCRINVPAGTRQAVLESLHAGHQGARRMFNHAALFLHWPMMHRDIEDMYGSCQACALHAPAGWREPLLDDVASAAMEVVGTDLFEHYG